MSDVHISNRTHAADSNDAPSIQARKPYTPPRASISPPRRRKGSYLVRVNMWGPSSLLAPHNPPTVSTPSKIIA